MSDRERFIQERQPRWEELEACLAAGFSSGSDVKRLADLYRAVASDLATAQSSEQPADVQSYLDQLASRAHNVLYGAGPVRLGGPWALIGSQFPRTLRANARFFLLASVLFYGPFIVGWVACALDPSVAENVLPLEQLARMESMYTDAPGRGGTGEDVGMAGHYVSNNIGIALRCFATGAFGGLGSLFFLVYNGAVLGTTFGYVSAGPGGQNLLTFACGHGSWELTGIVVAGTAGLRLGWALIAPGDQSRRASLRRARQPLMHLVAGAVAMLAVAAAIEAFWSASPVPPWGKWVFAALQIPVIVAWLALAGRR